MGIPDPTGIKPGGYGTGMIGSPSGSPQASQPQSPPASFCNGDQITEAFSDWMAFEVLPQYIESNHKLTVDQYRNGYANARRLSCRIEHSESNSVYTGTHPEPEKRINKILLVNPKIRAQMKCPEKHTDYIYCDSNTPIENLLSSEKSKDNSIKETSRGVR